MATIIFSKLENLDRKILKRERFIFVSQKSQLKQFANKNENFCG